MMDNLRAAANHVVLKIILALIILSFVLTGVGNYLIGGSGDYAAKVNGQTIERAQLEQAFQSERSRMQQQLGDQFSALAGNEGYMQQMRRQVLSQLIDNMLLDQYAKKLGLAVSDDQIKDAIRKAPYFQTNGQFDNAKYLDLIGRMGYTADNFAQSMRQQLVNQQVIRPSATPASCCRRIASHGSVGAAGARRAPGDHRFESAANETERRRRRTEGVLRSEQEQLHRA